MCMRKSIENIFWAAALLLALPSAWGFALPGPIGNKGDAWQTAAIGYGYNDPVAPKNINEEYRPVVPVEYYASDASFISYFGSAGLTNIDAAFGILNGVMCGLTNTPVFLFSPTNGVTMAANGWPGGMPLTLTAANSLDSYSADLSEFPPISQEWNYTAETLGLLDIKSFVLHEAVGELGLADPSRYVWTLHDRLPNPLGLKNPTCPGDVEYLVVQRNFDVTQNYPYSPYINGALYYFEIFEDCGKGGLPYTAITEPYPADPFSFGYTAVATGGLLANALGTGGFYTGLTQDDAMGFKYLLSTNNINWEATAPSGGTLLVTNVEQPQTLSTLPISLLFSQATTNDPNTLLTNYPGLTFLSVTTNIVTQITPTVTAYYTNLAPPYTNTVPFTNGASVYQTNGIVPFTNWSPVQYSFNPVALTTYPLAPFLNLAPFTDPATLAALYTNLVIASYTSNNLQAQIITNVVPYITNQTVQPVYSPMPSNGLKQVTVLTNIYYFTNQPGPTVINYDITVPYTQISTLDLGLFSDLSKTNSPAVMQALYPALQVLRSTTFPSFTTNITYVSYLTNQSGAPYSSPPKLVTKAVSTNYLWVTNWNYTFGNVFTNHYYTNRTITLESIWITNQIGAPYGSPYIAKSNSVTYKTNLVSGDFFLIPTNWCGFDLQLAFPLSNPPYTYGSTNVIIYSGYNSTTRTATGTNNVAGGTNYGLTQISFDQYTNYNYAVYPGICEPVLVIGTNYTTNVVNAYDYTFANVITNHIYTNTAVTVLTTNVGYVPGGSPDLLQTNITSWSGYTNLVSGDFYIVPTNWCGYQILSLITNLVASTNFVASTNGGGIVTSNYYTQTIITFNTNYIYSVRPGTCEPSLYFATNLTTNVVTQYSYYFGNIVTNSYYTNSPVVVLTTNLAVLTNGFVGYVTNIVTTNITYNGVSGDFYVPSPSWCGYSVLRTQLQDVVYFTNTLSATNLAGGTNNLGYAQFTITDYTNTILVVQPSLCSQAAPVTNLRRGVGRVQFIRANYDSLLGQFFQPLTNTYSMSVISNGQPVTEYYQRVVTGPDFLFQAADLTVPTAAQPYGVDADVSTPNFDQSAIAGALAGPGAIIPGTTIVFNENENNLFLNGSLNSYNSISTNVYLNLNQDTEEQIGSWGSFDASTNYPTVYPSAASITNLMNQLVIQVTPAAMPDGTNGVAYNVSFSATGGQSPYAWVAPNFSTLVPGLAFNGVATNNTATVSGTPIGAGTFNFTLQLTDSANRVINFNYPITIH